MVHYPPASVPLSPSAIEESVLEKEADKSMTRAMNKKNYNVVAGFETKYAELMTSDHALTCMKTASAALMLYCLY